MSSQLVEWRYAAMARDHAPEPRPDATAVVADTLEAVCLEGARRMLAAVLAAEVDAFLERPRYAPGGRCTGYRNGYARERRVRYVTAAALVNELAEAEDERMLSRVVARYGLPDLLCLDELGYLHLDRRGAELLFQVLTERDVRASIAVASNAPFSEWARTFSDPRLAAAVVDRLTFRAHILETGTSSYRLRTSRAKRKEGMPAA